MSALQVLSRPVAITGLATALLVSATVDSRSEKPQPKMTKQPDKKDKKKPAELVPPQGFPGGALPGLPGLPPGVEMPAEMKKQFEKMNEVTQDLDDANRSYRAAIKKLVAAAKTAKTIDDLKAINKLADTASKSQARVKTAMAKLQMVMKSLPGAFTISPDGEMIPIELRGGVLPPDGISPGATAPWY